MLLCLALFFCSDKKWFLIEFLDRLRMAKLDLNVNPATDDDGLDRKRQLTLNFEPDLIKTSSIIKSPTLPDRTRYTFLCRDIVDF